MCTLLATKPRHYTIPISVVDLQLLHS